MASLYQAIVKIVQDELAQQPGASKNLYQPATIVGVNSDGTYRVDTPWGEVIANPETDAPLVPLQAVHVSKVENGKPVVHGPRYG